MGLFDKTSKDIIKRLRFAMAGFAVSLAILVPGAVWYKSVINSMATSSTDELVSLFNMRLNILRQEIATELLIAKSSPKSALPFDLVTIYDQSLQFISGFRHLSADKTKAKDGVIMTTLGTTTSLSAQAAKLLIPVDSGLFDQVVGDGLKSGIMMVGGKPMLVAISRWNTAAGRSDPGYIFIGRWLDRRRLASNGDQAESSIEIYSLADDALLPADIRAAVPIAQRGSGFTFEAPLHENGFVYVLGEDVSSRPAFMAKVPWTLPWRANGVVGFALFFGVSGLAGLMTWILLVAGDKRQRKKVRRFDGLASLSQEHLNTMIESFPGFAFLLSPELEYLAISRILAGVTGHEPSFFKKQRFGSVASEAGGNDLGRIVTDLKDAHRWPRVHEFSHSVEGLGHKHDFIGMAHYLAKQDALLVILTKVELAQTVAKPELKSVA